MKIYTRIEFDSQTGEVLAYDAYEYCGPLTLCTGAEEGAAAGAAKAGADTAAAAGTAAAGEAAAAGTLMPAAILAPEVSTFAPIGVMESGATIFGPTAATFGSGAAAGSLLQGAKDVASIASPVSSVLQATQAMSASKHMGLLTGVPTATPLGRMPSFGDLDTMNALRGNLQLQTQRRGRAATILTSPSGDRLGN